MKSVKLDEKTVLNIEKITKGFGMSRKGTVNLVMSNLVRADIYIYMKREEGEDWEPATFEEVDEDEELEIDWEEEDDDDEDVEEESKEENDPLKFSPTDEDMKPTSKEDMEYYANRDEKIGTREISSANKRSNQLKLDAIKAGFVSEEDINSYVEQESG